MKDGTIFKIEIKFDSRIHTYRVEKTHSNSELEYFTLYASNKTLSFKSNRPLLRSKGLKNKTIKWTLINGQMHNAYVFDEIVKALDKYILRSEKSSE